MSGKKKILVFLLCLLILAATLLGLMWHMRHYEMIVLKFYPKDAQTLDLRGETIRVSHYDKIQRRFPDTKILWDVPFQNGVYPQDTETLTVSELQEADLKRIGYFEALKNGGCPGLRRICTAAAAAKDLSPAGCSVSGVTGRKGICPEHSIHPGGWYDGRRTAAFAVSS